MTTVVLVCDEWHTATGILFQFAPGRSSDARNALIAHFMSSLGKHCAGWDIELRALDPEKTAAQGARFVTTRLAVALAVGRLDPEDRVHLKGTPIPASILRAAKVVGDEHLSELDDHERYDDDEGWDDEDDEDEDDDFDDDLDSSGDVVVAPERQLNALVAPEAMAQAARDQDGGR